VAFFRTDVKPSTSQSVPVYACLVPFHSVLVLRNYRSQRHESFIGIILCVCVCVCVCVYIYIYMYKDLHKQ